MIKTPSGGEAYIVVHLYTKKRRQANFLRESAVPSPILSLDTAVSMDAGNLAEGPLSWCDAMRRLDGVRFTHIQQYKWGANTVKPTGLLHTRLPVFGEL